MKYSVHRYALSKPTQLLLCVLVALLSLLTLTLGGRLLWAGINEYRASSFLSYWEKQRQAPSDIIWDAAAQAMHNAIHWYPAANGAYAEQFGYMWQWRAYGADPQQASTKVYQQQALQQFRRATALRPSWPYAWSALAYAKLVAGEHDQEFGYAMQQAAHYGPSRIGINQRLAEIGLISWPKLDNTLRELSLSQSSYTARYSLQTRKELFALAAELGRVELLCEHLNDGIKPCAAQPSKPTANSAAPSSPSAQ